jgi:hypothetical protein
MRSTRLFKIAAAAAIATGVATAVAAQGGPRGERGWGMWGDNGPGWGMGMMWGRRGPRGSGSDWMLERVEGHLAFMKAEIKITEAQTAAWNRLADTIRTAAKHHNERMKAVFAQEPKTLPERLDAQEQFMSVRLQEIKTLKVALKGLYDVLSEDQRKEADDMGIPMVGPMVGMGGPWMGGGTRGQWNN